MRAYMSGNAMHTFVVGSGSRLKTDLRRGKEKKNAVRMLGV